MSGRRRAGGRAWRRRAGFTFFELILTLGLIVALTAMAAPNILAWTTVGDLTRAADEVRAALAGARLGAIERGVKTIFSFAPDGGDYEVSCSSADGVVDDSSSLQDDANGDALFGPHALPEGLTFRTLDGQTLPGEAAAGAITGVAAGWLTVEFGPEGSANDAEFLLVDSQGMAVHVRVRGRAGTVSVSRPYEVEEAPSARLGVGMVR